MRHSPSDHVKNQLKSIIKCRNQPGVMGQACNLNIRVVEAEGLRVQGHGWLSQKNNTVGKRRVSHSPPKEIFKMDDKCIKVIKVVSHQGHAEQSLDVIQCHSHNREHSEREQMIMISWLDFRRIWKAVWQFLKRLNSFHMAKQFHFCIYNEKKKRHTYTHKTLYSHALLNDMIGETYY